MRACAASPSCTQPLFFYFRLRQQGKGAPLVAFPTHNPNALQMLCEGFAHPHKALGYAHAGGTPPRKKERPKQTTA